MMFCASISSVHTSVFVSRPILRIRAKELRVNNAKGSIIRSSRVVHVRAGEDKKNVDAMSALDSMLADPTKEEEAKPVNEALYDDGKELKPKTEMSMEQRKKLRDEYLGLGGSANTKMPNYFLWISVVISALAVAAALTGAI
mmetsp:Transcript_17635/g.24353  ORF Transcript_17635/g.24353 Transcript_17635/m.24353 type:complete len:142 (+) Transcript_17635:92-517(+)